MRADFLRQLRLTFLVSLADRAMWGSVGKYRTPCLDGVLACDLIMLGGMAGEW